MIVLKFLLPLALLVTGAYFTAGVTAIPNTANPALYVQPHNHFRDDLAPGSLVTFNVKVSGFPVFDGWDVYVRTNDSVLRPVSIKVGDLFSSFYNAINCVDDTGFGCTIFDGLGVVHSSVASQAGDANGTATLFSIVYEVRSGPGTPVVPFLDFVFDPTGAAISHTTRSSSYGIVGPPDFTMSVQPYNPPLRGFYTITVISLNGFNATVDLSATSPSGLILVVSPPSVNLGPANIADLSTLIVETSTPGTYTVIITGSSGSLSHSISLTVTI